MNSLTLNEHYALASTTPATTERQKPNETFNSESYARAQDSVRLDISQIELPPPLDQAKYRKERYTRRAKSKKILSTFRHAHGHFPNGRPVRVARCGWTLGNLVTLNYSESTAQAFYAGVEHCSSIWACPTCSAKIRARRAEEIQQVITAHQETSGDVIFLTLTAPHNAGTRLDDSLDGILNAWKKLISGTPWKKKRHNLGICGYIRATEVTYGDNGWHPHLHTVLLLNKQISDDELQAFKAWIFDRWCTMVENQGVARPLVKALNLQKCDTKGQILAQYIAKIQEKRWNVAKELARGDLKHARESLTPFELLDEEKISLAGISAEKATSLWREYYQATYGRRCITWSRGLKEKYAIDEKTDEQIAEETPADAKSVYATPARIYRQIAKQDESVLANVLTLIEQKKLDLAKKILPDYHELKREQWE